MMPPPLRQGAKQQTIAQRASRQTTDGHAGYRRRTGLARLGVLAALLYCGTGSAQSLDDQLRYHVHDVYRSLRQRIPKGECTKGIMPEDIIIDYNRNEVNAWAAFRKKGGSKPEEPTITINTGLLDVTALISFYSLGELIQRFDALRVLVEKSNSPKGSIRGHPLWITFRDNSPPSNWSIALRSRLAIILAHELGHHCLGHTRDQRLIRNDTLLLTTLEDGTEEELAPGVPLSETNRAENGPASFRANEPCALPPSASQQLEDERQIEQEADDWAVKQVVKNIGWLSLSFEPLYSMIAELAILDAAGGRASSDGQKQYTHQVGQCRLDMLSDKLIEVYTKSPIKPAIPYLDTVRILLDCIERRPNHKETFESMVSKNSTLCPRSALALAQSMPGVVTPAGAGLPIEVVTSGAQVVPFLRRATDPASRVYAMQRKQSTYNARQIWTGTVEKDAQIVLSFSPAERNSTFIASVADSVVSRGVVDATGARISIRPSRSETGFAIGRELLLPSFEVVAARSVAVRVSGHKTDVRLLKEAQSAKAAKQAAKSK